ncbi:hypothetical protein [Actinophytocola gossypii]|uniref:Uncharacterized protein n=1 Tax=Actinophytocola gossypii TaxID=2812003 RepID=A0ABT2J9Z7_9PSEU|nr:hypothetical protein [Actinophytocola gossypii]MCT2584691.1 hypothetical protein [Actinophytocola gossypii]
MREDEGEEVADTPELRAQEEYLRAQVAAGAPMSSRPSPSQYGRNGRENG